MIKKTAMFLLEMEETKKIPKTLISKKLLRAHPKTYIAMKVGKKLYEHHKKSK